MNEVMVLYYTFVYVGFTALAIKANENARTHIVMSMIFLPAILGFFSQTTWLLK